MTVPELIDELRAAAVQMRHGVHLPTHIWLMMQAADKLYDLTHPQDWTLAGKDTDT